MTTLILKQQFKIFEKSTSKMGNVRATINIRNFTTTTKYYTDQDRNVRLLEPDPRIKTASHLTDEKSQSTEQLFDMLKENKQESLDNCYSADLSVKEADKVIYKASSLFNNHKHKLSDQERRETESNFSGAITSAVPNHSTEEDESLFNINKSIKKLMGSVYKAKSIQEVIPDKQIRDEVVNEAEFLIKELNTLSHNITTLTNNNNDIRKELRNRNVSLIEDQLTTFMDMPGNNSDDLD